MSNTNKEIVSNEYSDRPMPPERERTSGTVCVRKTTELPIRRIPPRPAAPMQEPPVTEAASESTKVYQPSEFARLIDSSNEAANVHDFPTVRPPALGKLTTQSPQSSDDEPTVLVRSPLLPEPEVEVLEKPIVVPRPQAPTAGELNDASSIFAPPESIPSFRTTNPRLLLGFALGFVFVGFIGVAMATRNGVNAASIPEKPPILLSLDVEPAHAVLYLDNQPLTSPRPTEHRADGALHELRVEAPGYFPRTLSMKFDTDVLVVVALGKK